MSLHIASMFSTFMYVVLALVALYAGWTCTGIAAPPDTDEFWQPVIAYAVWVVLACAHVFWIVGSPAALLIDMVTALVAIVLGGFAEDIVHRRKDKNEPRSRISGSRCAS